MGETLRVTLHAVRPDRPRLAYPTSVEPALSRSVVSAAVAAVLALPARGAVPVSRGGRVVLAPAGVLVVDAPGHLTAVVRVAVHDELAGPTGVTLGADWLALSGW